MLVFAVSIVLAMAPLSAAAAAVDATPVQVWESGGLSSTTVQAARVAAQTQYSSVYIRRSGSLRLMGVRRGDGDVQRPDSGFGFPMSTLSVDVGDPLMVPDDVSSLGDGRVLMSGRSAALRGARAGDVIELEGWNRQVFDLTIGAVLPDAELDWYEIVMTSETADLLGLDRQSSLVIDSTDADAMISAVRWFARSPTVRVGSADRPIAFTDATLPTVMVKERFGEFAFRPTGRGDGIEIEKAWLDANIVDVYIEGLGPFRCNRAVVPYLRAAIDELSRDGLLEEIDYTDFQLAGGCFNARMMRGGDKGYALSRHAWGVAIDFNPSTNPYGGPTRLTQAFGDVLRGWGFSWGATWTVPDGMHFEWARIPERFAACSTVRLSSDSSTAVTWSIDAAIPPCSGG